MRSNNSRGRGESSFLASDFASCRNDRKLNKVLGEEEFLFSDQMVKTNHQGKRQQRVLVVTGEALYNFKAGNYSKPQRRMPLDNLETILVSLESTYNLVLRVKDSDNLKLETQRRATFINSLCEAYASKCLKQPEVLNVSQSIMEKAFSDVTMNSGKVKATQSMLVSQYSSMNMQNIDEEDAIADDEEETSAEARPQSATSVDGSALPNGTAASAPASSGGSKFSLFRKTVSSKNKTADDLPSPTVVGGGGVAKAKKPARALPATPPKRKKSTLSVMMRRISMNPIGKGGSAPQYIPRCPPCSVPIGVVQPIWSLMERALEPLLDEDKPPAGLVRCADILYKLCGEQGPKDTEQAMKSVAALCFDKDAARALLKSLSDNVPVLGGSALIDSLDALQRCEDPVVRAWAIKSLWKILPMCMQENTLPITSDKWMTALKRSTDVTAESGENYGEAWFLQTFFRGVINVGLYEKEPLKRIAKRKGSFSMLGGGFRNSASFPGGLTPLMVQQAFSQVLLINLFDVERKAAYAIHARAQQVALASTGPVSLAKQHSSRGHAGGYDDDVLASGVLESDCLVAMEILLNSLSRPHDMDRKIEVSGKRICNAVLLPTLMGIVVLVEEDLVRKNMLKDVSLLLLRSDTNLKAVLDIPEWQMLFIPLLQTVPKSDDLRTNDQNLVYKYVLNLLTMIHTYCFKEPLCKGGPLGSMLLDTFRALAVFGDWNAETISTARWVLFGLLTQLSLTARLWWHDADASEWGAFVELLKSIENFVFFLPGEAKATVETTAAAVSSKRVAERALKKTSGASGVLAPKGSSDSMSENDGGSDSDEDDNIRDMTGKRRKRKLSITPVYELKGFEPMVRPLGPSDTVRSANKFDWIIESDPSKDGSASSTTGGTEGMAPAGTGAKKDAMKKHRVGLHLHDMTGKSSDVRLIEMVIELLKRMGITGSAPEDQRREQSLKKASKKQRGLLKLASEWCFTYQRIRDLLVDVDLAIDTSNQDALSNTMQRVAQFIDSRHTVSKASTAKLTSAQTKAVATKLEASVLRQRQLAKQKLEAHTASKPVQISSAMIIEAKPTNAKALPRKSGGLHRKPSAARMNARLAGKSVRRKSSVHRSNSIVSTTRYYSSMATAGAAAKDADSDSDYAPAPALPSLNEYHVVVGAGKQSSNRKFSFALGTGPGVFSQPPRVSGFTHATLEDDELDASDDGPPCDDCGAPVVDEFDAVHRFDSAFHSECYTCDECRLPLLKAENPDENNLFFNDSELVKFCGAECRMATLERFKNDMCPGCMCVFRANEKAIVSSDRLWHVAHLRCEDCKCVLGVAGKEHFPVSIETGEIWPFCGLCHAKRFRTCAKCVQPIEGKDDAVDALGRVFHRAHFNCFCCGENFPGNQFYVDGHGDAARALCEKCWNHSNSPRIICDACGLVLGDGDDAVELGGKIYHASKTKSCFGCFKCKTLLKPGEVFETKDSLPLCDNCFYESAGMTCFACSKIIQGDVLHAEGHTWHPACFSCEECGGGVSTQGRYMMNAQRKPVCEMHWMKKHVVACKGCGLPVDNSKVLKLGQDSYHPMCLVCNYCTQPLANGTSGTFQLNKGPDDLYYCNKHENGVCSLPECSAPCWADGKLWKVAGQYFCKPHFEMVSATYMSETCFRCSDPILEGEGLQALGKWYHVPNIKSCFVCAVCGEKFTDGEDFKTLPQNPTDPVHAKCLKS